MPVIPAPRFKSSRCFPDGASGERNANCSHHLKVANPARLVPLPPIEGVRLAAGGAKHPPRGFRGIPPDTPLVTFVVKRKSPGCRAWQGYALAERPLKGRAEGQRPSHIRGMQGPCPCSSSPGEPQSPLHLYPEKLQKLHPTVQPHRKKNKKIGGPPRADGESLFACCV